MKTYIRSGLFAAALSVAAFAADPTASTTAPAPTTPPPGDQPAAPGAHLRQHVRASVIAEHLGLSADQKTQLKAIRQQTAAAVKTIRANAALTPDQQREQIAAHRKTAHDQMSALLTAEQRARFAELTSHPGKMHALVEHRVRLAALAQKLGLTDAQRTQIANIRKSAHASIKPIRENASLSPEEKSAKIGDLLQAARTEVRGVLTPDQQKQLDELRERAVDRMLRLG